MMRQPARFELPPQAATARRLPKPMLPTMLPATTLPRLTALSLPQRRLAADAFRRGVRGCDGGAKFAVQARRRTMPARRLVLALAKAQREVPARVWNCGALLLERRLVR